MCSTKYGNILWQNWWAVLWDKTGCCSKKLNREELFPGEANAISTTSVKLSKTPSSLSHGKPGCALPFVPTPRHTLSSLPSTPVLYPFKIKFYDLRVFCTEIYEEVAEQHSPSDIGVPASDSMWVKFCPIFMQLVGLRVGGASSRHMPVLPLWTLAL